MTGPTEKRTGAIDHERSGGVPPGQGVLSTLDDYSLISCRAATIPGRFTKGARGTLRRSPGESHHFLHLCAVRSVSQPWRVCFGIVALALIVATVARAADPPAIQAERLLKAGQELVRNTQYLEALDLLDEAATILANAGITDSAMNGDVLYALAETKIKGRVHQGFPAGYVKSALKDVQAANKVRERIPDILPQTLAKGYYLEGFIQKRFFRRSSEASACFVKAVQVDPNFTAAKRELSELIEADEPK
jgi:hypothetical protein